MYFYLKVAIVVSRLPNGTDQWTSPIVVSQRKGYSNQNPVLFYDNQTNILYLFHTQQDAKKVGDTGLNGEGYTCISVFKLYNSEDIVGLGFLYLPTNFLERVVVRTVCGTFV
jgi:hypothetical protein